MTECNSCRDERDKKGLPPSKKVKLPTAVTHNDNFKHVDIPTVLCPYCDGETLINSAMRNFHEGK